MFIILKDTEPVEGGGAAHLRRQLSQGTEAQTLAVGWEGGVGVGEGGVMKDFVSLIGSGEPPRRKLDAGTVPLLGGTAKTTVSGDCTTTVPGPISAHSETLRRRKGAHSDAIKHIFL